MVLAGAHGEVHVRATSGACKVKHMQSRRWMTDTKSNIAQRGTYFVRRTTFVCEERMSHMQHELVKLARQL